MSSLLQDDLTRATTFFALAFGLTALGGLAIGDLRLGVEYGLAIGVAFAVFAYFFVVPTALDDEAGTAGTTDGEAAPDDPQTEQETESGEGSGE